MEVKIQIPDNCELIKDGDTYIVREKKNDKPRSWEEFCEKYPVKVGESYIMSGADKIFTNEDNYDSKRLGKTWCTSKQEAEAFLALMQLRQLRKAWIGNWEQPINAPIGVIHYWLPKDSVQCSFASYNINRHLSFPTLEMAEEFLACFKDLCETAKILL